MGSWYATCFMSHLPIEPGNRVAAIILAPRNNKDLAGCTCNADDYFVPIGTPIFGEYDDCGHMRLIDENVHMENYLKQLKLTIPLISENEHSEYFFATLEDVVADIAHKNLYVDKNRLDMVLIHEDLYYKLLNEVANRIPYDHTESLRDLHTYAITEVLSKLEKNKELFERAKAEGFAALTEDEAENAVFCRLHDHLRYSNDRRWNSMDWFANEYLKTKDENLIQIIADYILWHTVVEYSRSAYGCMSGRGSQSCEMRLQTVVAEFIIVKSLLKQSEIEPKLIDKTDTNNILRDTMYFWDNG
ncbi:MAG: hypothetical protein IJ419_11670 [Agathobacter sp.]|nr:hypothetical protein [Agathobacter sp.]